MFVLLYCGRFSPHFSDKHPFHFVNDNGANTAKKIQEMPRNIWLAAIYAILQYFGHFLGVNASQIPKYEPCQHILLLFLDISPKTTTYTNHFCQSGSVTLKNPFLTFLGGQNGPP